MLQLLRGHAESHDFECRCEEALSLFATLDTSTFQGLGKTGLRHPSAQFVAASARRAENPRNLRERQYPQDFFTTRYLLLPCH